MGWSRYWVCLGLAVLSSSVRAEPKTWEMGNGGEWKQSPATAPTSAGPVVNPTLDRSQQLFDARRYDEAHDIVLDWLKKNPKAPDRDRGLLLMAEVYYVQDRRDDCFYQCDELLDTCPESKLYFAALELQYRVADEYLKGHKEKLLGLRIIAKDDTAIDMLYRIQTRSPGSPIAETALLRTAGFFYHTSQFDFAADAYGAFLRQYPRSPEVPRARLRQAYANFAQFRGPRYDSTPLLNARAQFVDIEALTPDLAEEENIHQFIERIDEQLSAKLVADAQYYERVNKPRAAVFLYREAVQKYPSTKDAQTARAVLQKMPPRDLTDPPPPASAGQASAPPEPAGPPAPTH